MISRRCFLDRFGRCALGLTIGAAIPRSLVGAARAQNAAPDAVPPPVADVDRWTRTVCDLCGLGEPVFVGTKAGRLTAVKGIPRSRLGYGRLCPRAAALTAAANTEDRAVTPMVRTDPATKGTLEGLQPVSWDEAMAAVAAGFRAAREKLGPEGIAFLSSDAETCEGLHRLTRLAKAGVGTDHVDTPARLDFLHAAAACEAVFGTAANPGSVEDLEAATLVVLIGGDIAQTHPGLYTRVLDARRTERCRVVLVDWRKTLAASVADAHLRVAPGRELDVVNALAEAVTAESAPKEVHAAGVDLGSVAALWREARGVTTVVGVGALGTPSGAALARAVAQLHRASGHQGRAGAAPVFLARGSNATAVTALGVQPGRLPAGGRLERDGDRERTAAAWGVSEDALPARSGRPLLEWPAAVRDGKLGALFVHRANAAAELPDALAWREALRSAFTVCSTTHVPTETTLFADVVLPLALVTGESAGITMTLDRRCQLLEAAASPPGEARDAERLLEEVARAVLEPERFAALFAPDDPAAPTEWERWSTVSQQTTYDVTGIPAARLRAELDVPWPCAAADQPGTERLAPDAAAATVTVPVPGPARPSTSAELPFLLVTGPLAEHSRSRVRTGRAASLHYEAPVARLEMHADDARDLGVPDGEWVTVTSATGSATARLWICDRVTRGAVFLPEHFGFLSDLQGGSLEQKEPEALAHRVTNGAQVPGADAPAGLVVPVSVRAARRRDMRQLGA